GRELECSVLGNETPEASLPGEIFPHREFYDYRDKYLDDKTLFGIPADLPAALARKVRDYAVRAFKAVDGSGMARVDFLLRTPANEIFVSEVNTIPGFTEISMYPKLWEASGLPFPELLDRLIALGLERHRAKKYASRGDSGENPGHRFRRPQHRPGRERPARPDRPASRDIPAQGAYSGKQKIFSGSRESA
ncbi:MAG TPA: hypothetical protein PLX50_10095, partial [Candidatus Aminicenantes bacterium]|nr:hypothetical protein [Candidatus Aminicenantes bacterium]